MPTISEIAATVGFTVEDETTFDLEKFREHLMKTYTPTETILKDETIRKKVVGKVLGSLATKAAQEFELRSAEVEGKPLEEIFALVRNKYSGIITALSSQSANGLSQKISELEEQAKSKDRQLAELAEQHQADKLQWQQSMKAYKLDNQLQKAYAAINPRLTDDYHKNELVKTGFDTFISNTYLFELNEKDELLVKEKASGTLIKGRTPGAYATAEEILIQAAGTKGVLKKNHAFVKYPAATKQSHTNHTEDTSLKIHPNALKRTQQLSS